MYSWQIYGSYSEENLIKDLAVEGVFGNFIVDGRLMGIVTLFSVLGKIKHRLGGAFFAFCIPIVKLCTPLGDEPDLSLKSIGIVKRFEKSLKGIKWGY
ncbi:hypothetical protein [Desulfitobacterium sp.]|uniref:hypothetical protein n=1 Tax=Desulfitobacterium sp. TaxID=49981 RepID=UPI002B1F5532|nr:hypothetical protein [Desulfitobacterium sp.]MEA4901036.1 hypothetical protein [Desulfitobacterium sp.]